jgi:hypothetical protein
MSGTSLITTRVRATVPIRILKSTTRCWAIGINGATDLRADFSGKNDTLGTMFDVRSLHASLKIFLFLVQSLWNWMLGVCCLRFTPIKFDAKKSATSSTSDARTLSLSRHWDFSPFCLLTKSASRTRSLGLLYLSRDCSSETE